MARRNKFDPDEVLDPDELEEKLEEEGAFDSRGLLRDGRSTTIKMYMRDGRPNPRLTATQRSIAATHQPLVSDGSSNRMAMHKPGFRYLTDVNQRATSDTAKAAAYQEVELRDGAAWRNPSVRLDYNEHTGSEPRNTGAGAPNNRGAGAPVGAHPYSAAAEGTSCMINGAAGTLVREGAWLVCKPQQRQDAMGRDAKQAAYDEYDREAAVAYLRGK